MKQNYFSGRATLAFIAVFGLSACVSTNPQGGADALNTINTVASVAGTAQQLRGGGLPAAAGMNYGGQHADIAAMQNAPNDPRYKRAEAALKQLRLNSASCKQLQEKQQSTLDSIAEVEPLNANLMFKSLHERLSIQRDSLADVAKPKKCRMPTQAKLRNGSNSASLANGKNSTCKDLRSEYALVASAQPSAADTAKEVQGALSTLSQVASAFGGVAGSAQMMGQVNQVNNVANTVQAVQGSNDSYARKVELEKIARNQGCALN